MSERALGVVSNSSDGQAVYTDSATSVKIDVVIDRDVEVYTDNQMADNTIGYENTATFASMDILVGGTLNFPNKSWLVGRTLSDDGSMMTVIVT